MTTKQIIQEEIKFLESRIKELKDALDMIDNEHKVMVCPNCKTHNLEYKKADLWLCAYCGRTHKII